MTRFDSLPAAKPLPLLRRAAVAVAALSATGCLSTTTYHYVQSAEVRAGSVSTPPLNLSDGRAHHVLAARAGYATAADEAIRTRDRENFTSYPGNYRVERDRLNLGLDYQWSPAQALDLFFGIDATPSVDGHYATQLGAGLTFPFPWLHVRAAPSVGLFRYHVAAVDTLIRTWQHYDEEVVDSSGSSRSVGGSVSVSISAWVPGSFTGVPWTPFVQFQHTQLGIESTTLPMEVLGLDINTFSAGVDYETRWGHVRAKGAREVVSARGSVASYRGELTLALRFREGAPPPAFKAAPMRKNRERR